MTSGIRPIDVLLQRAGVSFPSSTFLSLTLSLSPSFFVMRYLGQVRSESEVVSKKLSALCAYINGVTH